LYAIRDATGTVESIPLIVASILSKKLAAGLDALVMDVKVGSGAFLPSITEARELAQAIVEVGTGNGMATTALLTDMNQVLGRTAGNAVEVRESIDHLTGAVSDPRLREVTLALSAELLQLGGIDDGRAQAERALDSGQAAERFAAMVAELGGPADLLEHPERHLTNAPMTRPIEPNEPGIVTGIDVRAVGIAVVGLGGGRARETDPVDHGVGFTEVAGLGERVGPGERPLAMVHAADEQAAARAAQALKTAYAIGDTAPESTQPVIERLT
jgi:thymidine phosphorylase